MKSSRMTTSILIAMPLGIVVGGAIHAASADPASQKLFASTVSIGSMAFLRLIEMIIAPLVFPTLVVGIGRWPVRRGIGARGGAGAIQGVSCCR